MWSDKKTKAKLNISELMIAHLFVFKFLSKKCSIETKVFVYLDRKTLNQQNFRVKRFQFFFSVENDFYKLCLTA